MEENLADRWALSIGERIKPGAGKGREKPEFRATRDYERLSGLGEGKVVVTGAQADALLSTITNETPKGRFGTATF
ncbi:unnamed protein product [Prunus armeniaca]|uniref:Uncharacterized protein n=1 Tax=Prunus armeniaca TaxID=36596 RepID=A0A6J5TX23_PRUAR|nr:unnamed protein product [Prunus armeniaca]